MLSDVAPFRRPLLQSDEKTTYLGTEKNHDSQRRDRILRFFLRLEIELFSPDLGVIALLN